MPIQKYMFLFSKSIAQKHTGVVEKKGIVFDYGKKINCGIRKMQKICFFINRSFCSAKLFLDIILSSVEVSAWTQNAN